jgi:hypothetical protein
MLQLLVGRKPTLLPFKEATVRTRMPFLMQAEAKSKSLKVTL